jgi:hypothetical protein
MAANPNPVDLGPVDLEGADPGVADAGHLREISSTRPSVLTRKDDLLGEPNSECRKWLEKRFSAIARGFEEQCDRSNTLEEYWNCYNCERDDNSYYKGEAEIYVPIIHDAVKALTTRWSNQLMPNIGRYVEVTASDGQQPYEIVALVNHYIKQAKFKANVLKPLIRNGIIEGQYNLYLDWQEITRSLVSRETHGRLVEGPKPARPGPRGMPPAPDPLGDLAPEGGPEIIDIREEDIVEGRPVFEVLHDSDVLVLPATADSIDEALEGGGMAVIVRRFSKEAFKILAVEEEFDFGEGEDNHDEDGMPMVFSVTPEMTGLTDIAKKLVRDVGIKSRGRHAILFEVWQKVPLGDDGDFDEDGDMRLCRTWYSLHREAIGLKRNPHWNDRCPLLSQPVEKLAGVFKGRSQIESVRQLQYEANDAANERADVDHMAAMPIVLNKASEGNYPRLIAKGAIWDYVETPPAILTFPDLSGRGTERVMAGQGLVFQSLSVNPAMIAQSTGRGGGKRNQAEVAMEQQVDLLTTAEEVDVLDGMLTEMVEFVVDMDHQYRDRDLVIRQYGELGIQAEMVGIPPLRNRSQYEFAWAGATQMRMNVAMTQNGTALINVLRGMQQQLKEEGMQLRLAPIFEYQVASVFGPTIARRVLRDLRHELSVDPEVENDMLREGHALPVSMFDNDQMHIAAHQRAMQRDGDIYGTLRIHLQEHIKQMTMRNMAQQQQMMQAGGAPGVPGGAASGVAGTPRPGQMGAPPRLAGTPPGAQPMPPRLGPKLPGRIPPTAMPAAGAANIMPRRF